MDFDAFSEGAAVVNHGVGAHDGFVAQCAVVFDNCAGENAAAFAEHGVCADVNIRADFAAGGHGGTRFDHGGGVYAACGFNHGRKQPRHFGEIEIGVGGDNQAAAFKFGGGLFGNNHCARAAGVDFVFVFGVGKKADVGGFGLVQRLYGRDGGVCAAHLAAESGGDLGEGVGFAHMRFIRTGNRLRYVFRRPQSG